MVNLDSLAGAKAGVVGLARSAAATYASRGLRFNCVAPGMVQITLTRPMTENELTLKDAVAMHPLGRIGTTEEIASAIAFFLSGDQSWVTGEVLCVDGGLARVWPRVRVSLTCDVNCVAMKDCNRPTRYSVLRSLHNDILCNPSPLFPKDNQYKIRYILPPCSHPPYVIPSA